MAIYSGFTNWKWWFSMAMLVYQRVTFCLIWSCYRWSTHAKMLPHLKKHPPRSAAVSLEMWIVMLASSTKTRSLLNSLLWWMDSYGFHVPFIVTESKDVDSNEICFVQRRNVLWFKPPFFLGEFPHLLPALLCPPGRLVLEQCVWGLSLWSEQRMALWRRGEGPWKILWDFGELWGTLGNFLSSWMMVDMISGKHHRCGMLGMYDGRRWLTCVGKIPQHNQWHG